MKENLRKYIQWKDKQFLSLFLAYDAFGEGF